MDNKQFLDELDLQLHSLPDSERSSILNSFRKRMEESAEGQDSLRPDERWGQPQKIAEQYRARYYLDQASRTKGLLVSIRSTFMAASVKPAIYTVFPLLLAIGLILGGLILLAVFMSLVGLATSLAALGVPVIQDIINLQSASSFEGFYTGIVIISCGLLFLIAAYAVFKFFLGISARTLKKMAGLENLDN